MKKKIFSGLLILCGVVLGGVAIAATPSATMLSNTCVGCHGPNGNSEGPASPTIAGISTEYFMEAMEEYKSGERPSTIMGRIAKGYSEEELQLMAGFFSKQKFNRDRNQDIEDEMAKKGAKLHDKYCEKCHEEGGRSSEDDAGILAGQWMPYLRYTMTDYLSGNREMTKKMKKRVNELKENEGDKGFEELFHYYGSLK